MENSNIPKRIGRKENNPSPSKRTIGLYVNMNIDELKNVLDELGVPKRMYAINESLRADCLMLNQVKDYYWEYFYFDERGGINDYKRFDNENDACTFFFERVRKSFEFYSNHLIHFKQNR